MSSLLKLNQSKDDDLELLLFGFEWLRYALFGEDIIEVNEEYKKTVA